MTAQRLTGQDPFHRAGHRLDHGVLDLWAWADSELMSNALRDGSRSTLWRWISVLLMGPGAGAAVQNGRTAGWIRRPTR